MSDNSYCRSTRDIIKCQSVLHTHTHTQIHTHRYTHASSLCYHTVSYYKCNREISVVNYTFICFVSSSTNWRLVSPSPLLRPFDFQHTATHSHTLTHTHTHPRVCTLINKTWYYWINSWMNRIYDIIYKSWWQMVGTVKRKGHTYSHTWWHSNQSDVSYYWIHSWMNRIYDRIYES